MMTTTALPTDNAWLNRRFLPLLLFLMAVMTGTNWLAGRAEAASGLRATLVAQGGSTFHTPLDAVPSPDGDAIYFVARAPSGEAGVFQVAASSGRVESLLRGAPLVEARGITVSSDGRTLYVADPQASAGGAVFALPLDGGAASPLPGTVGLGPRALDLVRGEQGDILYIAGTDPVSRRGAAWRILFGTDAPIRSVLDGGPLAVADGIAVASNGTVFVAGRQAKGGPTEVVLKVQRGMHSPLVRSVRLGSPAGIALAPDETRLLVSSLAADGTSQVLIVDLASGNTSTFNEVIGANRSSGGLHRTNQVMPDGQWTAFSSHREQSYLYAWADSGYPGRVYGIQP